MNEGNAILVIEDETTLAKNVVTYLRRAGYDAEHAPDAEQGLARLETFRPDVIVLDYNLPGYLTVSQRCARSARSTAASR